MARRTNTNKGKETLELLGVKIAPALKKAIERESEILGIAMSTYARQLLITGWQSRHQAPIAQNPRERTLTSLFNDLPLSLQESVLTMVEALYKKHKAASATGDLIPTELPPASEKPRPSIPVYEMKDPPLKKGGRR